MSFLDEKLGWELESFFSLCVVEVVSEAAEFILHKWVYCGLIVVGRCILVES